MHCVDSFFPGLNTDGGMATYLKTGARAVVKIDPKSIRAAYREELERHNSELARQARSLDLDYVLLDTGALYRAIARDTLVRGGDPRDADAARSAARGTCS